MSLHREIRRKAANKQLRLSELGPNSRAIAQRMIASGELLALGGGVYRLNEVAHVKKKTA
jgi:hypothetical protein